MLIGDVFTDSVYQNIEEKTTKIISRENFNTWYEKIIRQSPMELAVKLGIPLENASLMYPSAVIYKCLIDMMGAELSGFRATYDTWYCIRVCGADETAERRS